MQATARAHPNIALIKYWGKRDAARNLPAVGSISITLDSLSTDMVVRPDAAVAADDLVVNSGTNTGMLPRVSQCLDSVAGEGRAPAHVSSESNYPIAAGLASSAAAFAALVVAGAQAFERRYDEHALVNLAGRASGSAARSLLGGFVELTNSEDSVSVATICSAADWPLLVVVAITESGPKPVGSTEAMEISRQTSPFYSRWIDDQPRDLDEARAAIATRDFERLGRVAEHNCLKMHSVMWASRPPLVYWNSATLEALQTVRRLQADGIGVFFTIDAGPQVKAICLPEHALDVSAALADTPGVEKTLISELGGGARLLEPS